MKYWNGVGRHQAAYDEVSKLIPVEGACNDAQTTNKSLDLLRRATTICTTTACAIAPRSSARSSGLAVRVSPRTSQMSTG